jgi:hypothetical protein
MKTPKIDNLTYLEVAVALLKKVAISELERQEREARYQERKAERTAIRAKMYSDDPIEAAEAAREWADKYERQHSEPSEA